MAKLLLVEDDQWLGESYRKGLSSSHQVRLVESLEQAIQAVDAELPDVIIADFILDGRNSIELLHELSSYTDTAAIPIILCSSLGSELKEFTAHLQEYGVVRIIDKSQLSPELMSRAVMEALHESKTT